MSDDIKAGDLVVCVDVGPHPRTGEALRAPLKLNAIYRVATVGVSRLGLSIVTLTTVALSPGKIGILTSRFRRLNDKPDDIALIERIKRPVREPSHV